MLYVWVGLTVFFVLVELLTAQLTTIWFAVGSVASLLLSAFVVDNVVIQIVVFVVVSALALVITRPVVKKFVNKKAEPTNADVNIGKIGIVTEDISNIDGRGEVKAGGIVWTARSTGDPLYAGERVRIVRIEGVKLIVEKI